jgi:predicted nucleic acid-binding protein
VEVIMDVVIDTSALIAVLVGEPERNVIVKLTAGHSLIGPGSIPWEIGNAFSAMLKQNRIPLDEVHKGLSIFSSIPIRYAKSDLAHALTIAHKTNMYAYDAYILDCAIRHNAPLLSLDQKLMTAALSLNISIWEV